MKKLVIFGTGYLAELAHFYFTNDSDYEVVGFTVDSRFRESDTYLNLPLVDFESLADSHAPQHVELFIAIGYNKVNSTRILKFNEAKSKGYKLASYVSSKSTFWKNNLQVGENVMIMEGNNIMPFCKVEDNVLIWIGNILSHHSTIEKNTTITSHVAIGGNVVIGEGSFLGLNSTIRDSITIAPGSVIAASSNVIHNTEPNTVYMGNPAQRKGDVKTIKL